LKFFFSSRRRHTRFDCDWSSDVCSSDLVPETQSDKIFFQREDLLHRHKLIKNILSDCVSGTPNTGYQKKQDKLDAILTHKVFGRSEERRVGKGIDNGVAWT